MSNNNNNKNTLNDQVAALVASNTGGSSSDSTQALASLLMRKFAKEEQDETVRAAEQAEFRKQQNESIARANQARLFAQRGCTHMKQNFTTGLNGQRDHQGELHCVCSYCTMEFNEEDLAKPEFRHLAVPGDRVGGPIR